MEHQLDELLEHVCDHLSEEQPEAVAELSDAELRRRAAWGIERARKHGFEQPEAITAFVTLLFLVSPRFDEHPRIAASLKDRKASAEERLKALFEKTSEPDWDEAAALGPEWPR